jgi:polar amino acid transport system substrate-binding protein
MIKRVKLISNVLFLLIINFTVSAEPVDEDIQALTLATTQWCPYTCADAKNEFGIVGKYITKLLSVYNIKPSIHSYPWSRAIHLAKTNKIDGLLTASHSEAPNLLFTNSPIGSYQMCFYTLKSNDWQFNNELKLGANILSVIQDYGYGEPLDSYLKSSAKIMYLTGDNVTERLVSTLFAKRADVIVADKLVLAYEAKRKLIDISGLKNAGCLAKNNYYLALRPSKENKALLKKLDRDLMRTENITFFNNLLLDIYRI